MRLDAARRPFACLSCARLYCRARFPAHQLLLLQGILWDICHIGFQRGEVVVKRPSRSVPRPAGARARCAGRISTGSLYQYRVAVEQLLHGLVQKNPSGARGRCAPAQQVYHHGRLLLSTQGEWSE